MKTQIISILLLAVFLVSCKTYVAKRMTSYDYIQLIKENGLLVRLESAEKKVRYLDKNNNSKGVEAERKKVDKENQKLMKTFKDHFDFCDVFFFHPNDAHELKAGKFNKVKLYTSDAEEIKDNSFLREGYLVSSFGTAHGDQYIYDDGEKRVSLGGTGGASALVVMDKDYIQLSNPFPYRALLSNGKNKKREAVKMLNQEFKNYYYKYEKKKFKMDSRVNLDQ